MIRRMSNYVFLILLRWPYKVVWPKSLINHPLSLKGWWIKDARQLYASFPLSCQCLYCYFSFVVSSLNFSALHLSIFVLLPLLLLLLLLLLCSLLFCTSSPLIHLCLCSCYCCDLNLSPPYFLSSLCLHFPDTCFLFFWSFVPYPTTAAFNLQLLPFSSMLGVL